MAKDHFNSDSPEDRKARKLIEAERKAALFDYAMEEARQVPRQLDEVKRLSAQVEALQQAIERPQRLEATLRQPARPKGTTRVPKGTDIAFAAATAHLRQHWGKASVDQTLSELFPDDGGRLQRQRAKSATNPASTTGVGWGAELSQADVLAWVEELKPVSIFGKMAAAGTPLLMGQNTAVTMPHRGANNSGALAAAFTEERASLPIKTGMFGSTTFYRTKAGVLSVFSNELAEVSTPTIESTIRQMIADDTAEMLDGVLLDPTIVGVPGVRPASPWTGAANQPSGGTTTDLIIADISWLVGTLTANKQAPRKPAMIMDNMRVQRLRMIRENGVFLFRDEIERGELLGIPLLVSATVPTDKVYVVDLADFTSWSPPPIIDISGTATVALADDDGVAPTMADTNAINDSGGSIHISDAAGTIPATKVVSAYQINASILRHIQEVSWGMLRTGTAAYLTGVAW